MQHGYILWEQHIEFMQIRLILVSSVIDNHWPVESITLAPLFKVSIPLPRVINWYHGSSYAIVYENFCKVIDTTDLWWDMSPTTLTWLTSGVQYQIYTGRGIVDKEVVKYQRKQLAFVGRNCGLPSFDK
jgi:hypothetical protein